jgi:phage-related minor tail protein
MLDLIKFKMTGSADTARMTARVKQDLGQIKGALAGVGDRARRVGKSMRNIGAGMSVGITAPMVMLGRQSLRLYDEQVKAQKAVEQAIISTGGAAKLTAPQLFKMASSLQSVTTFGDEDILQNVTAPLLTFTKVSDKVFERAQANVLDMATLMKMDLKSASVLVGKALNDPVKGLSALSRTGVQFSEDQKEVIKSLVQTGDVAGAQVVILEELEKQFKGQAAAVASTDGGKLKQLSNTIGDVKEQLGEQIVPFLTPLAEKVKQAVEWFAALSPEIKKNIVVVGGLAAAAGPLIAGLGIMAMGFGAITTAVTAMGAALLANPVLAVVAALAAGAYLIYRNWDGLSAWFTGLWDQVRQVAVTAWDGIKTTLTSFTPEWMKVAWGELSGWFGALWEGVKASTVAAWEVIRGLLSGEYSVGQLIHAQWQSLGEWFAALGPQVVDAFKGIWADVKAEVSTWPDKMIQVGKDTVAGLWQGIKSAEAPARQAGGALADWVTSGTKDGLKSKSPSRVFMGIGKDIVDGLGIGMQNNAGAAEQGITDVVKATTAAAKTASPTQQSFTQMFTSIVTGATRAKDAVATFFQSLATRAAGRAADLIWTSLGLENLFSSFLGPVAGSSAGAGGGITAFASGGIVSAPTVFPMTRGAGLMGEAGPEAIMPLSRVGGVLGVSAQAAAPQVNLEINVQNMAPDADVQVRNGPGGRIDIEITKALDNSIRSGRHHKAMADVYGIRPRSRGA